MRFGENESQNRGSILVISLEWEPRRRPARVKLEEA